MFSGVPKVLRRTGIATTGTEVEVNMQTCWLCVRNTGVTNAAKMYFTKADFDADVNYVTIPVAAAATPNGEWAGPVELTRSIPAVQPATLQAAAYALWFKAVAGTADVEIVAIHRRT